MTTRDMPVIERVAFTQGDDIYASAFDETQVLIQIMLVYLAHRTEVHSQ
jgi:hypothetical protein